MDSGDGKNDDGDQLGAAQPAVSISAGKLTVTLHASRL